MENNGRKPYYAQPWSDDIKSLWYIKLWQSWLEDIREGLWCTLIVCFYLYLCFSWWSVDYTLDKKVRRFFCFLCKEEELEIWWLTTGSYAVNGMALHVPEESLRCCQCCNSLRAHGKFLEQVQKWDLSEMWLDINAGNIKHTSKIVIAQWKQ